MAEQLKRRGALLHLQCSNAAFRPSRTRRAPQVGTRQAISPPLCSDDPAFQALSTNGVPPMSSNSSISHTTRREFLAASAAGGLALAGLPAAEAAKEPVFEPIRIPEWVHGVTRMAYLVPSQVPDAAKAGVQVVHTNTIWPYYPLRKDGGGLSEAEAKTLRQLVDDCHQRGMKLSLGLPPFPNVALVKKHPDWRIHPDDTGAVLKVEPREDNLGTRVGCNLGPWGDYLIDICAELVEDYKIDGYSFDGNYHPPLCFCPACKKAYKQDMDRALPAKVSLDDVAYREYLVWRGKRLEDHYRRMQTRIKKLNPDAVLMSWTVNAGRYGHFLYSPRAMPTRVNLLFDLPMQEMSIPACIHRPRHQHRVRDGECRQ